MDNSSEASTVSPAFSVEELARQVLVHDKAVVEESLPLSLGINIGSKDGETPLIGKGQFAITLNPDHTWEWFTG